MSYLSGKIEFIGSMILTIWTEISTIFFRRKSVILHSLIILTESCRDQTVEKTAEEIRTSKQRSYTQVSAIQKNLESAINSLFYAVSVYAKIGGISDKNAEIICKWGDSVLEDTDKEFQRLVQLVQIGALKKEYLISWCFHCSVDKASEYIPQIDGLFGGM